MGNTYETRQVYNLFQEPVEQLPLGFSIAEEKNQSFKAQTGKKISRAFGAIKPVTKPVTRPVTKPLGTEKV